MFLDLEDAVAPIAKSARARTSWRRSTRTTAATRCASYASMPGRRSGLARRHRGRRGRRTQPRRDHAAEGAGPRAGRRPRPAAHPAREDAGPRGRRIALEVQVESARGLVNVEAIAARRRASRRSSSGRPTSWRLGTRSPRRRREPPGYDKGDAYHYPDADPRRCKGVRPTGDRRPLPPGPRPRGLQARRRPQRRAGVRRRVVRTPRPGRPSPTRSSPRAGGVRPRRARPRRLRLAHLRRGRAPRRGHARRRDARRGTAGMALACAPRAGPPA